MNKTDYWVVYQSPNEEYSDCLIWHRDVIDTLLDEYTSEDKDKWLYSSYGNMIKNAHVVITEIEGLYELDNSITGMFKIIYNDREYKISITYNKKTGVKIFGGEMPSEKWLHDFTKHVTIDLLLTAIKENEK